MSANAKTLGVLAVAGMCLFSNNLMAKSMSADEVLVEGQNSFAVDLLQKTIKSENLDNENVFMSAYSVSTAMSMVYLGAKDATEVELRQSLNIQVPQDLLPSLYQTQMSQMTADKAIDGYDLKLANYFWAQTGFGFLPTYTDLLADYYESGVGEYNFKDDAERAQAILDINNWASENTNDKIPTVVDDKSVTPDTRFVLTNAIYFLGDWLRPFPSMSKRNADFKLSDGSATEVEYMSQTEYFKYFSDDKFAAVELPYSEVVRDENGEVVLNWDKEPMTKAADVSMWLVLPEASTDLATFVSSMDANMLDQAFNNAQRRDVYVQMPSFEVEAEYKLKNTMKNAMGMELTFSNAADFSGMTGKPNITIGEVIHKTFIRVDNKGTEAAAVTAVIGLEISSANPELPVNFIADRPFVYLIRDNTSGAILFMGTLNNPSK